MALSVVLTFVLGAATAAAFLLVGGHTALIGTYVLFRAWPSIYALEVALVVVASFVVGRLTSPWVGGRAEAVVVLSAWLGEYLVLASGVLAEELDPLNAIAFWLLATAGLLQPVAAWLGWMAARPKWRPRSRLASND